MIWILALLLIVPASSLKVSPGAGLDRRAGGAIGQRWHDSGIQWGDRCVEASTMLDLREAPFGASVGRISAGDRVWIRSQRSLAQYAPRVQVQAWRIEHGRVVWTAWLQPALRECGH